MSSHAFIDRLARQVARTGSDASPAWVPRVPQLTLHQGTVTRIDVGNNVLDFQFPDSSGIVLPSVRYLQPYTADNPPAVGHVAWGLHYGTDFMVLGQHVVPNTVVTF